MCAHDIYCTLLKWLLQLLTCSVTAAQGKNAKAFLPAVPEVILFTILILFF